MVSSVAQRQVDRGMLIGPSPTGGAWTWDPWTLYRAGRITNPNLLVIGDVGSGKSSLVKSLVWRGLEFGRGAQIVDPKGEYEPLAEAAGVQPIRLEPGGSTILNPLDPGRARDTLSPTQLFHRNIAITTALVEATLGRPCRQAEMVALTSCLAATGGTAVDDPAAVTKVHSHGDVATLPQVADALLDPPDEVAARMRVDRSRVVEETRELALALSRLVDDTGDLAGMFNGRTNVDADALADLTVVDINAVYTRARSALPLVMICASSWLQLATTSETRPRWSINDEGWALLRDPATARWVQSSMKFSRQLGLSVVNVMHRLSDLSAAGDAGSEARELARGVLADSGTVVVYRQKPGEAPLLQQELQLNRTQTDLVLQLGRGRGLWIVDGETRDVALVDHALSDQERRLVDTDGSMR